MKKISYLMLIMLSFSGAASFSTFAEEGKPLDIQAMTFNIRMGIAEDGENHWGLRKGFTSEVIRDYMPDVLGVQEAYRFQLDELKKRLPEYGEVGIGRDGGTEGEYSAILYDKKRFEVEESGTFWLSETPEEPSQDWESACRRICTWARLSEKKSARSFYIYNTHLDHRSQEAREKGIHLIMKRIKERAHQDPLVLTGDFNAGEENVVIAYLKGTEASADLNPVPLVDSFRSLYPDEKVVGTFNGFKGQSDGPKIDYVFVTPGTRVLDATIVRTSREGRYPSDHYPVTARLRFE